MLDLCCEQEDRQLLSKSSEDILRYFSKVHLDDKSYEKLDLVKRDINETNIVIDSNKNLGNIKDFYNQKFISGPLKTFISKFNAYGDINPNSTPIRYSKANLLQKMHLNSPIKQTLQGKLYSTMSRSRHASFNEDFSGHKILPEKSMTPFSRLLYAADSPLQNSGEPMLRK